MCVKTYHSHLWRRLQGFERLGEDKYNVYITVS